MKCHICDADLQDSEVQWNPKHKDWDPCNVCQEVIDSVFNTTLTEAELDEVIEYIEGDTDET